MAELDLTQYHILRPEKVRWMYDTTQPSLLESLKSKTLRTLLSKVDSVLEEHNITVIHKQLDQQTYDEWLAHYQKVMTQKGYDVLAKPEWFTKKITEGKNVGGFFFYHNNELMGSLVYAQIETQAWGAFKTSSEIAGLSKKHRSLGSIIDFVFIREMLEQNMTWITLGSMRNAFGVINTIGNLEYKLRFGYLPVLDQNVEMHNSVPLPEKGPVIFFGLQHDQLQLFSIGAKEGTHLEEIGSINAIMPIEELS